jgi:hypothetical protein
MKAPFRTNSSAFAFRFGQPRPQGNAPGQMRISQARIGCRLWDWMIRAPGGVESIEVDANVVIGLTWLGYPVHDA